VRGGRETSDSHDDAMLSRLYHGVSDRQEPHYAAEYDMTAGLKRYQSWLDEHGQDAAPDAAVPAAVASPRMPGAGMPGAGMAGAGMAGAGMAGVGGAAEPTAPDAFLAPAKVRTEWSADLAVSELYSLHYRSLVRLAAMLVRDTQTAEEVVQDAFVSMHDGWGRLKDTEKALAYMRQAVVNKSRSVLRHRVVVDKNMQNAPPDMPSAEHGAFLLLERDAVIAALRKLPERQREAIALRYYADLSEAEIAATMKISRGAVKSHTARGMAALKAALEQELWRPPTEPSRAPRRSGTSSPTSCAGRCTRLWIRSSPRPTAWSRSGPRSGPIRPYAGAKALLAAQDVGTARLLAELIGAAGLRAQDVGAAGLLAENVGAAGLRAKFISAAGLCAEDVGAVIRCHRGLLLAGFSHSLHHRGPTFIGRPGGRAG
jgi:RNA polymerase sigma-70 factor (sigma-E family)